MYMGIFVFFFFFFFSSRRRHTRYIGDWSSDVCSSDLTGGFQIVTAGTSHSKAQRAAGTSRDAAPPLTLAGQPLLVLTHDRSEERRVGKECRSRWAREH